MDSLQYRDSHEIQAIQDQKLCDLLTYVQQRSPFYQELFATQKTAVGEIRSIADMWRLPVTTKEDLQRRNFDFLCVPPSEVIEYASTSGTLGTPVTIALTRGDLDRLAFNEFQSFSTADGSSSDIYQLMLTLDRQFMAGIAYYMGLRELGAGIIRLGPGVPSLQLETILRLQPTAIVAVPSFILKLVQFAKETGVDLNSTSVKKAICIGENIRNSDFSYNMLGKKITEEWNLQLYSTYASTEMQTAFTECREGKGGHLQPGLLIMEILDENNQQLGPGEPGEVTITTLGVEGMPLIRYKTGDICSYFNEPCGCGRYTTRISPVLGRKKQMIKFKGTTLYPPALFDILNEIEEVIDFAIEAYSNEIGLDEVRLYLHVSSNTETADHRIRANIQARLRVSPSIKYVDAATLQQMHMSDNSRKPSRFIDRRK